MAERRQRQGGQGRLGDAFQGVTVGQAAPERTADKRTEDDRGQDQAGVDRARAGAHRRIQRQIGHQGEDRPAAGKSAMQGKADCGPPDQVERHERFAHRALMPDEDGEQGEGGGDAGIVHMLAGAEQEVRRSRR